MEPCDGELHPNEPLNQGQRPQINIVNLNWDAIGREGGDFVLLSPHVGVRKPNCHQYSPPNIWLEVIL